MTTVYEKDICAICIEPTFCRSSNCNHYICSACYKDYISHQGNMIIVDELYNYQINIKCPTCRNPNMGDNICVINLSDILFNVSTDVVLFLNRKIDVLLLSGIPIDNFIQYIKNYHNLIIEFRDMIKHDIRYAI